MMVLWGLVPAVALEGSRPRTLGVAETHVGSRPLLLGVFYTAGDLLSLGNQLKVKCVDHATQ